MKKLIASLLAAALLALTLSACGPKTASDGDAYVSDGEAYVSDGGACVTDGNAG